MKREELHENIETLALALTLFTFPFRPFLLNNICVIILAINWLLQGCFTTKLHALRQSKLALLYAGLYFALIVSFFLSEDKNTGAKVLERNLFVLIVPVIMATSAIKGNQLKNALFGFVAGCLLAVMICLINALYRYNAHHEIHYFFYHELSKSALGLHAIYFSLYIASCIVFLILNLESSWRTKNWKLRSFYLALILIFCAFLILLSSKTIIISLTALLNLLFIIWIVRKNRKAGGVFAIVIINVCMVIGIFKIEHVKDRFIDTLNSNIEFIKQDAYSELTVFTGVTVRLTFWKFVVEILDETDSWWTGMSIGDGDNALHEKAVEKKLYGGNPEMGWTDYTSYNAHNQFFQYLLYMGIPGVLYFILILIAIIWHAIRKKKLLLLLSALLFTSFCVTESVLDVNKGIIFFSIFLPLLIYADRNTPTA